LRKLKTHILSNEREKEGCKWIAGTQKLFYFIGHYYNKNKLIIKFIQ